MEAYIVVKGNSARDVIRILLPPDLLAQTNIVVVGERSNLTSVARSLLVAKRRPLALIADSNTVDEESVKERHQLIEELLWSAAGGIPFKFIMMVPAIETLFFLVPNVLERLSGRKLSPEQLALAVFQPKQVLTDMFKNQAGSPISQLASAMTADELHALRETPPAKELIEFLTEQAGTKALPQTA